MSSVVFLKGVNVGGHKTFRPSTLAKDLAHLDVVNIGAAGTFIVRKAISQTVLRATLQKALSFQTEVIICRATEITDLVHADLFRNAPAETKDVRRFLTIAQKAFKTTLRLPIEQPVGNKWETRIIAVRGRFALSIWRRMEGGIVYPNAVVEKHFCVRATTRSWNTISAISEIVTG